MPEGLLQVLRGPVATPARGKLPPALALGALLLAAAATGFSAGRSGPAVLALTVFVSMCVIAVAGSWRLLMVGLLLYVPFAGLPILATYPDTAAAALVKDFLFLLPAYVGALTAALLGRERLVLPGAPVLMIGALALLVAVQAFNPQLPQTLIGLIGIKVWLFYLPLMWLGYNFASSKDTIQRLLATLLVLAMVPCLIGIAEAVLLYGGKQDLVYGLYGPAAEAATQGYVALGVGDTGALKRLPSIFQFVAQYWLFSTATIALGYAAWRGNRASRTMALFGPVAIGVAVLATLTCGLRGAFVFTPFLLLLIAVLEGAHFGRMLAYLLGSIVAIIAALAILRVPAGPLAALTGGHALFILDFFREGFEYAADRALLGLGTGVDSVGISYAFDSEDPAVIYGAVGGFWQESLYVKAFLELGVIGLLVVVALLIALARRSFINHRSIADPELRSMSAAFLALFIWNVIYAVKTAYIDLEPMNVYVWFFLGLQWRLVTLRRQRSERIVAS